MAESPATPTFEEALERLQAIVHELEDGQLGLETSLARFEQGIGLLKSCYAVLEQAEKRIEVLTGMDALGNPETSAFDAAATLGAAESTAARPGRRRASGRVAAAGDARETAPGDENPSTSAPSAGQSLF